MQIRTFPWAALCLTLFAISPVPVAGSYDATACNNSPDLCDKSYAKIWQLGAHDSAFVRTAANSWSTAANQYYNITIQLDVGVRLLQAQLHDQSGVAQLCHTSCSLFDGGLLLDYLTTLKTWLDSHTSEVVTLLLVNSDTISPSTLYPIFTSAGLAQYLYTPPTSPITPSEWPTLQHLIGNGTRLVTFLSDGADETTVPNLLDEFSYVFETAYSITDPANYTCTVDRPTSLEGLTSTAVKTHIGLANHFLYETIIAGLDIYAPNDTYSATLNGNSGIGNMQSTLESCSSLWGTAGGMVLVDFFNEGDPIAIIDTLNNVTNPVNRMANPATPDTSSTSSSNSNTTSTGWAALQALALSNSSSAPLGEWIFVAGGWFGSIGKSSFTS
ncbi:hypothetical protein RUND412_000548 [Rhizina undulata]